MFRRLGLSLLVLCVCAILPGATLFAGITNGDFSGSLSNWEHSGEVSADFGYALMQRSADFAMLGQVFSITPNDTELQFDLTFEFGEFSDTDTFRAFLFQWSETDFPMAPVGVPFYWISTSGSSHEIPGDQTNAIVMNKGDFNSNGFNYSIRTVTVPISSGWTRAVLWFDLSGDNGTSTNAIIDNVVVPEPATMTLGLIGVAAVGAIRRRMR